MRQPVFLPSDRSVCSIQAQIGHTSGRYVLTVVVHPRYHVQLVQHRIGTLYGKERRSVLLRSAFEEVPQSARYHSRPLSVLWYDERI